MKITVDHKTLYQAFTQLKSFISKEQTRYYLMGINLCSVDGKLIAVATDGHRLGKFAFDVNAPKGLNIIVPLNIVDFVCKIKPLKNNETRDADILINEQKITVTIDSQTITSDLVGGKFPDWNRVMPQNATVTTHYFSPQYMKEIADAFSKFAKHGYMKIAFDPENESAPFLITGGVDDSFTAVLIPKRFN